MSTEPELSESGAGWPHLEPGHGTRDARAIDCTLSGARPAEVGLQQLFKLSSVDAELDGRSAPQVPPRGNCPRRWGKVTSSVSTKPSEAQRPQ